MIRSAMGVEDKEEARLGVDHPTEILTTGAPIYTNGFD